MDENKSGMGWAGLLLFFVVIWILFGAFNRGGFGGGYGDHPYGPTGCNCVSNCQVEKQGIIDNARTNFLIEQNGANTRTAIADGVASIREQNNQIYVQGLQERIFDLNRRLDGIECRMLTKPHLSGIGVTCNGQLVPPVNP